MAAFFHKTVAEDDTALLLNKIDIEIPAVVIVEDGVNDIVVPPFIHFPILPSA